MKKRIIILVLLAMQIVHSQTKNKTADALFDKMYYIEAAKSYELSVKNGDASKETLQRLGDAHYFNTQMQRASEWYKKLLEEYFKTEANIFVTVKLAGFRYTINGEVGSTGTKTIFQEHVNIMEAVANAGDITITGDRKSVTVIRQTPTGVLMNDLDLTDINVMKSPYYYLQPNDYVYVKPLKQKTWGTGKTGIESITTIITVLSLATTVFLLLKN